MCWGQLLFHFCDPLVLWIRKSANSQIYQCKVLSCVVGCNEKRERAWILWQPLQVRDWQYCANFSCSFGAKHLWGKGGGLGYGNRRTSSENGWIQRCHSKKEDGLILFFRDSWKWSCKFLKSPDFFQKHYENQVMKLNFPWLSNRSSYCQSLINKEPSSR